jgi:hypothetical protein
MKIAKIERHILSVDDFKVCNDGWLSDTFIAWAPERISRAFFALHDVEMIPGRYCVRESLLARVGEAPSKTPADLIANGGERIAADLLRMGNLPLIIENMVPYYIVRSDDGAQRLVSRFLWRALCTLASVESWTCAAHPERTLDPIFAHGEDGTVVGLLMPVAWSESRTVKFVDASEERAAYKPPVET